MDVMIGGKSAIDLTNIKVRDWDDATKFLCHYGFDPEKKEDAKFIHAVIVEAIDFIRRYLLPTEWARGKRPPDQMLKTHDARQFLLWASASGPKDRIYQVWACSILRVMHTISHIEGVRRHFNFDATIDQIIERIEKHIFQDKAGNTRFGNENGSIELYKAELKRKKSRDSIILKLLHKKGNVAETIYDMIGVRLVTKSLPAVMQAVKLLRDLHMITFPNCNPGRARNTLLDIEHFKGNLEVLKTMLNEKRIQKKDFDTLIDRIVIPKEKKDKSTSQNPHTGDNYKSVQLTCRQLVYNSTPGHKWLENIEAYLQSSNIEENARPLLEGLANNCRLYFNAYPRIAYGYLPFEVHILDKASYLQNKTGSASHDHYKSSQLRAARRRVLAEVLTLKAKGQSKL